MDTSDRIYGAYFDGFAIKMTLAQAKQGSHPGQCDEDVEALTTDSKISAQLSKINPNKIRYELGEYGGWSEEELKDDSENRRRIVWIACGNILEELEG